MNGGFWEKVNSWYENIGEKIKTLAKLMFVIGAILELLGGFITICCSDGDGILVLVGLLTMILGPIISFVSSWTMYAFGHLVQTTEDNFNLNARQSNSASKKSEAQAKADNERIKKIEALRAAGMITEEEYLNAVAKVNNGGAE